MEALGSLFEIMSAGNGLFTSMLGDILRDKTPVEKYPYERLGEGYELRPIQIKDKKTKEMINVEGGYSHLYHNELKVSDEVFRKGGICSGFKDGYCPLIHYVPSKDPKKSDRGYSFGTHVIINHLGDITIGRGSGLDYPYHIGGHLGHLGNYIYDLRSGKAIAPKSSITITGASCIIIEHRYEWYDKEVKLPLGIYRIDFSTAEILKLDEVK